jgi:hypothetical protein
MISTETTDDSHLLHRIGLCQTLTQSSALIINQIISQENKRSRYIFHAHFHFISQHHRDHECFHARKRRNRDFIIQNKISHCSIPPFQTSSPNIYKEKNLKSQNIRTLRTMWMNRGGRILLNFLTHGSSHFTSSLDIRYRKVKLCGIHSMVLRGFPSWHFWRHFLTVAGKVFWIISRTTAGHKPESLV